MPRSRTNPCLLLFVGFIAALVLSAWPRMVCAHLNLPTLPEKPSVIQDNANLLSSLTYHQLEQQIASEWFETGTPIAIVTIRSMAEYGAAGYTIEQFARELFSQWRITYGGGTFLSTDRGILLLVSVGDRAARIELGPEWGHRWDGHAQRIMDRSMVPAFREGHYEPGIVAGTRWLVEMAKMGPDAAPRGGLIGRLTNVQGSPFVTTPLPMWGVIALLASGLLLVVLAYFVPEHRKWMLITGIGLIIGAFVLYVLIAVLALALRSRVFGDHDYDCGRWGRRSWGGSRGWGGFGGGFGGGGFSGGGATGRW